MDYNTGLYVHDVLPDHPEISFANIIIFHPDYINTKEAINSVCGYEFLNHLGFQIYEQDLLDGPNCCVPELCHLLRKDMPVLTSLWLFYGTREDKDAVVEDYTPLVSTLARASTSLTYVRVRHLAWRIDRTGDDALPTQLDDHEDQILCPEVFRHGCPTTWSPRRY